MGINVNLTPQLEELVRSKVASGQYTSVSEVVCEALRLLEEQDRITGAKLERLRGAVSRGLSSGPSESWNATTKPGSVSGWAWHTGAVRLQNLRTPRSTNSECRWTRAGARACTARTSPASSSTSCRTLASAAWSS